MTVATRWIIIGVTLALITWDVIVIMAGKQDATISRILLNGAIASPFLSFAFGFLMGHLFWPQTMVVKKEEKRDG